MRRMLYGGTVVAIILALVIFLPASGHLLLPVIPETAGTDATGIPETLPPETSATQAESTTERQVVITENTDLYKPETLYTDEIPVVTREIPKAAKETTTEATTTRVTTTVKTTKETWDTSKWPQVDPELKREIDPDKPMICLTFDDGPSRATKTVLDVLGKYQARATFFVIGSLVVNNESMVRRIVKEGHEIGNHTYSHVKLTSVSTKELLSQIERTNQAVYRASGYEVSLFRPPYNLYNDSVLKTIPLPVVCWSIDPKDWQKTDPESIARAALRGIRDGDIILLHDSRTATGEAVKILVPELISRGYQLVTVSEMFAARGIELRPGSLYRKAY